MKKVYICSRYRADEKHTVEENVESALEACRYAASMGYAPYAPHLYLPRCLDDNNSRERTIGLMIGQEFLKECDEVWQWGTDISEGMAAELAIAEELRISVRVFDNKTQEEVCEPIIHAAWRNVTEIERGVFGEFSKMQKSGTCSHCDSPIIVGSSLLPLRCPKCKARMDRKDGESNG